MDKDEETGGGMPGVGMFITNTGVMGDVRQQLFDAGDAYAEVSTNRPSTPDAGLSTEEVGTAIQNQLLLAALTTCALASIAHEVDLAKGAYEDVDNRNGELYALNPWEVER